MSQSHIPHGCYSVKSAAEKLQISTESLLKKMVWRGWLYKGIFKNDPLKYMPLQEAIDSGLVLKIHNNGPVPRDWEIAITKSGMEELGAKMTKQIEKKNITGSTPNFIRAQQSSGESIPLGAEDRRYHALGSPDETPQEEHDRFMTLMKAWGLAS